MSDDLRNRVARAIYDRSWMYDRTKPWTLAPENEKRLTYAMTDAALAEMGAVRDALQKTRAVLEQIESHRRLCMQYDEENGHVPRTFDEEDLRVMEIAARTALKEIARVV